MGHSAQREAVEALFACPVRPYPTVDAPWRIDLDVDWAIPAPEVVQRLVAKPPQGCWIDHVPTGAEIIALNLLCSESRELIETDPFYSGDWSQAPELWMPGHPERLSPQMVMPDAWFEHEGARQPPPPKPDYTPSPGRTVGLITGLGMSGSGYKYETGELSNLWREGLLATRHHRALAREVLVNGWLKPEWIWHELILDEDWTMRRAAQVLREAGIEVGDMCAWTNRWARPPRGATDTGTSIRETALETEARCLGQLEDGGAWPLGRTEAIARQYNYRRVE